jgi:hypothetical protein
MTKYMYVQSHLSSMCAGAEVEKAKHMMKLKSGG